MSRKVQDSMEGVIGNPHVGFGGDLRGQSVLESAHSLDSDCLVTHTRPPPSIRASGKPVASGTAGPQPHKPITAMLQHSTRRSKDSHTKGTEEQGKGHNENHKGIDWARSSS